MPSISTGPARTTPPFVALIALGVLTACPGNKGGGTTPRQEMPAAVQTYAALRFVPAEVSYAVVGARATDLTLTLSTLAEVVGVLGDFDADAAAAASREAFGYDITSAESLAGIGIDVQQGAAIWGTGLSPTFAVGLADPARFEEFIDQMRSQGMSIQSQVSGGIEVLTVRFDEEIRISWAIVDRWILARFELLGEKQAELAWLDSARAAAGALGAHPDFLAAMELEAGAPIAGVVRPAVLAESLTRYAGNRGGPEVGRAISACAAPLRDAGRALISARIDAGAARGTIAIDLANSTRFDAHLVAASPGWYASRQGAPLQLDLGLDLAGFLRTIAGCDTGADALAELGARTAHVAIHAFEDGLPARGGAYLDLTTDAKLRALLREIPGLGMFSKKRQHAGLDVVDVKVPMFLSLTYHLSANLGLVAMGDGQLDAMLAAGGEVRAGEILHLDLRPHEIPTDAWDLFLGSVLGVDSADARERTIRRLRRWDHAVIDARLEAGRITIDAAGDRRR